jgi:hypothetical protein
MRRLEDVLRDLAEQDQQLSTDELITRIEQGLSGRVDSSVVAMPGRSNVETIERTTQMEPKRRWNPVAVTVAAAVLPRCWPIRYGRSWRKTRRGRV